MFIPYLRRSCLTFVLLAFATASFADIYKWVDADGQTHYGQQAPQDQQSKLIKAPLPPAINPADAQKSVDSLMKQQADTDKEKQDVSLASYVERMKEDQEKIYYVTADSFAAAKNSPHLEIFRKKGIEVILMADRVDEWLISNLTEFDGKQLQSVAKGELDLDKLDTEEEKKEKEETNKDFEAVLKQMKEVLGDKVSEVRTTNRLTDSPACLVTGDNDMSLNMERIMKEAGQSLNMMGMGGSKPIFEINPTHALVSTIKDEQDDARFADITHILFDQAILSEGGQLDDPAEFVHKLNGLLQGLLK